MIWRATHDGSRGRPAVFFDAAVQVTFRLWVCQLPGSGKYRIVPVNVPRNIAPNPFWASNWPFTWKTQSPMCLVPGSGLHGKLAVDGATRARRTSACVIFPFARIALPLLSFCCCSARRLYQHSQFRPLRYGSHGHASRLRPGSQKSFPKSNLCLKPACTGRMSAALTAAFAIRPLRSSLLLADTLGVAASKLLDEKG